MKIEFSGQEPTLERQALLREEVRRRNWKWMRDTFVSPALAAFLQDWRNLVGEVWEDIHDHGTAAGLFYSIVQQVKVSARRLAQRNDQRDRRQHRRSVSLDDPISTVVGSQIDRYETFEDAAQFSPEEAMISRERIEAILVPLSERQRQVAALLSRGLKPVEIAQDLAITPGRVSQIIDDIRARFRQSRDQP